MKTEQEIIDKIDQLLFYINSMEDPIDVEYQKQLLDFIQILRWVLDE